MSNSMIKNIRNKHLRLFALANLLLLGIWVSGCNNKRLNADAKATVPSSDIYYTCSMDPQVISDKPGKCPICGMNLTPVQKAKTTLADELMLSDQQIQLGNITTDTIKRGAMSDQQVFTATLNFDQSKTSSVSARVMGRIEKLYFKAVGDYVPKGAPIFDLYSEDLNNAKQELLLALDRKKTFTEETMIDFDRLVQSARQKLLLWGLSDSQVDALAKSGKSSYTTTFYAPAAGYITSLEVQEGSYTMEGGSVMALADLSSLWAEAQVYTSQMAALNTKATAEVQVPGLEGRTFSGPISFVNPEVASGSRINLIRISITNPGNQLKPGMPAYVVIRNPQRNMLALPIDAVIRDSKGAVVWVKTGANTFRSRMVTTGQEGNGTIEIQSGLQEGDVVVHTGAYLLNSEFVFKRGTDPMAGHNH